MEALDTLLWTYAEESFLPHGTKRDGNAPAQPVYLTTDDANPNEATVRFLVDGAEARRDGGLRAHRLPVRRPRRRRPWPRARAQWKAVKEAGCEATYWQQSPEGRWEKKA